MFARFALLTAPFLSVSAQAQAPDAILIHGKIATMDGSFSVREALSIRDGKIASVGTTQELQKQAGPRTRVIDLEGRTVIPGLIDSHLHAIRAALSFSTEVNWIGARSLPEALTRITEASHAMKPGSWLIVAGGWNVGQFKERRPPTQAELTMAAPNNPVYVQLGYGWAMLTPLGYKTMGIAAASDLPAGARYEKDTSGKPTGAVTGSQAGIIALFDKLPQPTFDQQVEGTKKFFRELNRLGLTGVVDPGGNNMAPDSYQAVYKVWRDGQLSIRIDYSLCGFTPGQEFEEYKSLTRMLPMGFGDDMLRFTGIGERITAAMNNNNNPNDTDKERYYQIVKWAADREMTVTMHWGSDESVHHLLEIWERVNKEVPIAPLRWSIAHLNDASEATLQRMKALGVGWTVQDAMYFDGDNFVRQRGKEAASRVPPVVTARRIGVAAGAGTDAHRVASYNPFTALQWFLDGKTVTGAAIRAPEETPSRNEALRMYTLGSAWIGKDEAKRGSLEPGKFADLAVLSKDYLTVPVDEVGGIESVLTMVGGKVVYSAGPFTRVE
jgi:predicted amidohydrolase YtcJ